jgi:hypothetical protein
MIWGFAIGPCYLATFCVFVRGSLHWRFALSIPITVGVSVGAAFVPVGDSMLGFLPIWLVTGAGAISLCVALINLRLCATHEHLQLDANFHVPYCALVFGFFGVLITHVELTRRSSIMAIGLVLPIGCLGAESMYNQIVKRTCSLYYYEPKSVYMAIALSDEPGHDELPEFPPPAWGYRGRIWKLYSASGCVAGKF